MQTRKLGNSGLEVSAPGRGYLTGKIDETKTFDSSDIRSRNPRFTAEAIQANRAVVDLLERIAAEKGGTPAQVALAWLLHNPVVTAPIIGPRTVEQLTSSLRALEISLSDETMKRLDEIWPGPGGEAPKAYAW
jgi:aryl-alcohol dehydrogenase-like predicted oxidoreductase